MPLGSTVLISSGVPGPAHHRVSAASFVHPAAATRYLPSCSGGLFSFSQKGGGTSAQEEARRSAMLYK